MVLGKVGAGKTSLLLSLLGETAPVNTTTSFTAISGSGGGSMRVRRGSGIALLTQDAWVLSATLQDNILFGMDLDTVVYSRVIEACCLGADFAIIPDGDQVHIHEN